MSIVTWASDSYEFKRKAQEIMDHLGQLFVADVLKAEPVEVRRARLGGRMDEEREDMIVRASTNPNAIIYGTFHTYESDDA